MGQEDIRLNSQNFFKNIQGKDLSKFENKNIKEVSVFLNKNGKETFNEKLTNKEDFISMLKIDDDEKSVSKEDLEELYSMLDFDNDGKVSESELKLLASLGGSEKSTVIDTTDIRMLSKMSNKKLF